MSQEKPIKAVIQGPEGEISLWLVPKVFSTGSQGYHASGKVVMVGAKYQVNFQLVRIGSKKST